MIVKYAIKALWNTGPSWSFTMSPQSSTDCVACVFVVSALLCLGFVVQYYWTPCNTTAWNVTALQYTRSCSGMSPVATQNANPFEQWHCQHSSRLNSSICQLDAVSKVVQTLALSWTHLQHDSTWNATPAGFDRMKSWVQLLSPHYLVQKKNTPKLSTSPDHSLFQREPSLYNDPANASKISLLHAGRPMKPVAQNSVYQHQAVSNQCTGPVAENSRTHARRTAPVCKLLCKEYANAQMDMGAVLLAS